MPFLYHKRPETAFFHTSRHPLFLTLLVQKRIIYFIQRDMKNTVFIRGFMGSAPSWIPSFFREKIMS